MDPNLGIKSENQSNRQIPGDNGYRQSLILPPTIHNQPVVNRQLQQRHTNQNVDHTDQIELLQNQLASLAQKYNAMESLISTTRNQANSAQNTIFTVESQLQNLQQKVFAMNTQIEILQTTNDKLSKTIHASSDFQNGVKWNESRNKWMVQYAHEDTVNYLAFFDSGDVAVDNYNSVKDAHEKVSGNKRMRAESTTPLQAVPERPNSTSSTVYTDVVDTTPKRSRTHSMGSLRESNKSTEMIVSTKKRRNSSASEHSHTNTNSSHGKSKKKKDRKTFKKYHQSLLKRVRNSDRSSYMVMHPISTKWSLAIIRDDFVIWQSPMMSAVSYRGEAIFACYKRKSKDFLNSHVVTSNSPFQVKDAQEFKEDVLIPYNAQAEYVFLGHSSTSEIAVPIHTFRISGLKNIVLRKNKCGEASWVYSSNRRKVSVGTTASLGFVQGKKSENCLSFAFCCLTIS